MRILRVQFYFKEEDYQKVYLQCLRLSQEGSLLPEMTPLLGFSCYHLQLYHQAIHFFQEGLKEGQTFPHARFYIALCYLKLKNKDKALATLKEAVYKDREYVFALKLLLDLLLRFFKLLCYLYDLLQCRAAF